MVKNISIILPPAAAADEAALKAGLAAEAGIPVHRITGYQLLKRSIDARARQGVRYVIQAQVFIDEPPAVPAAFDAGLKDVSGAPAGLIVGAGPAGLFAALRLISLGIKPVILERGKDVRSRRRDLAAMNKGRSRQSGFQLLFRRGRSGHLFRRKALHPVYQTGQCAAHPAAVHPLRRRSAHWL